MANLTETAVYETGIFQLEKNTPPQGGEVQFNGTTPVQGHANAQAQQLANRTAWLKAQIENQSGVVPSLKNYTELRAYPGQSSIIDISDKGVSGRFYYDSLDTTSTDDGGITIVNGTKRWKRYFDGDISVKWYGAVGDGVADDTDCIQRAVNYAASLGGGSVDLGQGIFRKADTSPSIKMASRVRLKGRGESSIIFNDDRPTNLVRQDVIDVSLTIDCTLQDFRILGTVKTYPTETGQKNSLVGTNIRNIRIENVTFDSLRFMAMNLHYVRGGYVSGCTFRDIMRDGCRMTHSQDIRIIGNDFKRVADDAIALHMLDASSVVVGSGAVVSNNTFEFCQGVKVLGAKVLAFHDNIFRRSIRLPLVIASDYDLEGNTPMFSIDVHDNHFIDSFRNYRTPDSPYVIKMTFRPLSNGSLTTRPGVNSSVLPYNWLNDNDASGAINSGSWGICIRNNVISTTQNATGQQLSTLGYGNVLDRKGGSPDEGYFDPVLTAGVKNTDGTYSPGFFDVDGIYISGPIRSIAIQGNMFSGGGVGRSGIILDATDSTSVIESSIITNNIFTDWPGIGVNLTRTSLQARYSQIRGNTFNLDPLFRHFDHNTDNTWASITSCVAIVGGGSGLSGFVDANDFAHCGAVVDVVTRFSWGKSNTVMWQPLQSTGLDGNVTNKGIRFIPSSVRFVHIIYDGDPTSSSFKNVTTTPRMGASAVPTTGTYVYGHITENTSPSVVGTAGSRYIISGWIRLNTGSSHVLNTDWSEMRTLTGS